MTGAIVIGVGNVFRRDDAVGPAVVERLRAMDLTGVELAECDGEPTALIELWSGSGTAVVVDGIRTEPSRPGRVHRLSAQDPAATTNGGANTHGIGLGDAVALAQALDLMPTRLLLYAVEVADTGFGTGLSPDVERAIPLLAEEIARMLTESRTPGEDVA